MVEGWLRGVYLSWGVAVGFDCTNDPSLDDAELARSTRCIFEIETCGVVSSQFKNNLAKMCSGSEKGSYLRLIDLCVTQL